MTAIEMLTFRGNSPGPALLVLGAIHGNEPCGTIGIGRTAMELQSGIFALDKGTLTLAPICNPEAYRKNLRFCEENLNRVIQKRASPDVYEHKLANAVTALIDACDIVLDLHSYASGTKPFLFLDNDTAQNRAFAKALNVPHWITGWNEVYADKGELNSGDTMSYAQSAGKSGVLVECGRHDDPQSAVVAYESIRAALAHFGMAPALDEKPPQQAAVYRLHQIHTKTQPGDFAKPWQHLDPVRKNEPVMVYENGSSFLSPVDGVVILPKAKAKIDDEWLYLGIREA